MDIILKYLNIWIFSMSVLAAAIITGLIAHRVFIYMVSRIARRASTTLYGSFLGHCRGPSRVVFPLIFILFCLPVLDFPKTTVSAIEDITSVLLVASLAWLLIRLVYVFEDVVLARYDVLQKDNLRARRIHTQFGILKRVLIVIIVVFALAIVLMSFEKFRRLGTGILASAGLFSLVVGLAAQRVIGNLLAGIQIAITQPLRLDDVVVVENEWGRVEEISLTHVVVKLWDLRRLVLPISYFIEKPFQNWTRASVNLLGTVLLYVDYGVPVQAVRDELLRILKDSPLWDGKVWALEVTNAAERTLELRALMSSPDSQALWSLRCEVREKLIGFIQDNFPHVFPKVRAQLEEKAGTRLRGTEPRRDRKDAGPEERQARDA